MPQLVPEARRLRVIFNQIAPQYDAAGFVCHELGERLCERLAYIRMQPKVVLDLGCGTGLTSQHLHSLYPDAQLLCLDGSEAMLDGARARPQTSPVLSLLCADAHQLPLADQSVDFVFSNALMPWCDVDLLFLEVRRVLKPNGFFLFSTFGPDTLAEIRRAWQSATGRRQAAPLPDLHDLGDRLLQQGFLDPVMDMEKLTLRYAKWDEVMSDLRQLGLTRAYPGRSRQMVGRQRWQRFLQALESGRAGHDAISLTCELVYGHAWVGDQIAVPLDPLTREAVFPLSQLRLNRSTQTS